MHRLAPVLALLAACSLQSGDDAPPCTGKCDGATVDQTCDDVRYDDGVCQPSLDCAVPDIDCFVTFEDDARAATWFAEFETKLAAEEGRAPRTILPPTDPRYQQGRALLDRGWAAFREHRPVGLLRDARPALIVIEDPAINAFVIPDLASDRSAFSVTVQTGLLAADATDDALLGVMMHELQHAVALHLIGNVREEMRTYYVAPHTGEPIGTEQADDTAARAAAVPWRAAASEVGPFADVELGGFSIAGDLDRVQLAAINAGDANDHAACAPSIALANQLRDDITASTDPLDGRLTLDRSTLPARVTATLTALRDDCLANFPYSFVEVVAVVAGTTPQVIEASLSPHDRALVTGVHVIDAVAALVADRRATMRDAVAGFERATSRPFSALRYFSFEEDADDITVPVLRAADLDPTGQGGFLLAALSPEARARCEAVLANGEVPAYGVDLGDEHHATCWRAYHVDALAARSGGTAARGHAAKPAIAAPARLPLPLRLADRVIF